MPRWASLVEIAGVSFTGCRAILLDPHVFSLSLAGSVLPSADGTPHIQTVNVGVRGKAYGIQMAHADADKIIEALAAINTALSTGLTFPVHLVDALHDINVQSYPDFNQPFPTYGPESEGIIENVIFRFVAVAAIP
jgi:hypothetical protein